MPLALLLLATYVWPAVDVIRYSFTDATLLNPEFDYTTATYQSQVANPDLPGILWVTLLFVVSSVVLQLALGLLVALALHRGMLRGLPGVSFVRVVILCSWIVPGVASRHRLALMFNEASYGFLNALLKMIGPVAGRLAVRPEIAIWSAVIANVWRGTAFSMILLYAGLLVIPRSLYEAAAVDGATALKQLWYITLPQLRPILLINTILISIFTLNTLRPDPAADRRRSGPGDRGAGALRLQHDLPQLRPLERRGAGGDPAAHQPRLHLLLRPAAAEGGLRCPRPETPASPTPAPTSPTS